jgi:hypothetical protein
MCYFDNTQNTRVCRSNDNTYWFIVGAAIKTFPFAIDNVTTVGSRPMWKIPRALTILQVDCYTTVDNVVGNISECAADNVTSCVKLDNTDFTITNAVTGFTANSGFENASFAAGSWMKWEFTSEGSADLNQLSCTVQYRE